MLDAHADILGIIEKAHDDGWVLEPDAKRIFSLVGLEVPRYTMARTLDVAVNFAQKIDYPVVAKIVSPRILHKSDVGGVAVGIAEQERLGEVFQRFQTLDGFRGVLVEEMVSGVELILGATIDNQFGPMILLGMGGTGVEIYQDVSLRMAPLSGPVAMSMVKGLKAHKLLEGYRGAEPVDMKMLADTMMSFSALVMDLADRIESIDINPLFCSGKHCVVGDARIMLKKG
jgi:acetate---CoA ligase (ADP-forming) subunit beta